MRKLVLKTALITFGVAIILAVLLFGIISLTAPAVMMRFCDSLGMDTMSADYAYQNYQLNGDVDSLARSFEIAAESGKDSVAVLRFQEFYGEENSEQRSIFSQYCALQDENLAKEGFPAEILGYHYRSVVCAQAAVSGYRLAESEEDQREVCRFAVSESEAELTEDSPVAVLAAECVSRRDAAFCKLFQGVLSQNAKFNRENQTYLHIMKILEEQSNE